MKASVLAAKLMKHPNLDVEVLDIGSNSSQMAYSIVAVEVDTIDVNGVVQGKKLAIEVKPTP